MAIRSKTVPSLWMVHEDGHELCVGEWPAHLLLHEWVVGYKFADRKGPLVMELDKEDLQTMLVSWSPRCKGYWSRHLPVGRWFMREDLQRKVLSVYASSLNDGLRRAYRLLGNDEGWVRAEYRFEPG